MSLTLNDKEVDTLVMGLKKSNTDKKKLKKILESYDKATLLKIRKRWKQEPSEFDFGTNENTDEFIPESDTFPKGLFGDKESSDSKLIGDIITINKPTLFQQFKISQALRFNFFAEYVAILKLMRDEMTKIIKNEFPSLNQKKTNIAQLSIDHSKLVRDAVVAVESVCVDNRGKNLVFALGILTNNVFNNYKSVALLASQRRSLEGSIELDRIRIENFLQDNNIRVSRIKTDVASLKKLSLNDTSIQFDNFTQTNLNTIRKELPSHIKELEQNIANEKRIEDGIASGSHKNVEKIASNIRGAIEDLAKLAKVKDTDKFTKTFNSYIGNGVIRGLLRLNTVLVKPFEKEGKELDDFVKTVLLTFIKK